MMDNIQNYDSFMKRIASGVTVHWPDHYPKYSRLIHLSACFMNKVTERFSDKLGIVF
jgi:hypothetical protein